MITTISAGLSAEHAEARPLLDRIESQRHGRVQGRRTYADGTQYLIFSDPHDPGAAPLAWTRFVSITPAGVTRLREILHDDVLTSVATAGAAPIGVGGPQTGAGTITWVVYLDDEERIFQTASGSYDMLPPFVLRLDEAVSQNVQRAE